ncbi:hypothetical protein [Janthinobacterium aquaticum]|uniref:hypothetical protein n=1 Tax=Janthinobacterium sp. FT58W TaxID=2654254 RepID=UPI00126560F7|nr:hypothetical protein [Janthinobacterium sp. FT58W]KAB8042300.1 hypothetical protein GCM43_14650 [Janthinobacterium sp. FT58W]
MTASWSSPPQLAALAAFYARAKAEPATVSDAELLAAVRNAHWPTNCWAYVDLSFALIAPACQLRPHLTAELIAMPIAAMIAGGLDSVQQVLACGERCAVNRAPYVATLPEAAGWLAQTWPTLDALVAQVFAQQWLEAMGDD